jgi:predicted phage baseplate assembly protein
VTGVSNPLPATGGADRDSRDQGRRNAPVAVAALDRLVSVQDYADFARSFAGIGKASAIQLSDGHRQIVYLTIAGTDDTPIDKNSDLYVNLLQAFQQLGDPNLPIQVDSREDMLLVIAAKVGVPAPSPWKSVADQVKSTLRDAFRFDQRKLGQSVFLSEIIRSIQQVPGVAYVEVTALDSVSETDTATSDALKAKIDQIASAGSPKQKIQVRSADLDPVTNSLRPAQLAFLSPDLPDTLILTEADS